MRAFIVAMTLLLAPTALHAAPERPPSGTNVDDTRNVAQLQAIPQACVAIGTANATLYLSLQRLNRMRDDAPAKVTDMDSHLAQLSAARAGKLLDRLTGPIDRDGCLTLPSPPEVDELHVILAEVENGAVAARAADARDLVETLRIRYLGTSKGPLNGHGRIFIKLPDRDANELDIPWWIS